MADLSLEAPRVSVYVFLPLFVSFDLSVVRWSVVLKGPPKVLWSVLANLIPGCSLCLMTHSDCCFSEFALLSRVKTSPLATIALV